ncbi:DUF2129 domain-containing protein [Virgibacillus sp. 179-BFC.A HS]|uniref:UPF0298 protein P5G51_011830 n=1 Tax=Tigheibacillus jepli TaxID=3035914 RepID=A0ABU5CKG8_9BACI|nr:DUF2129 domain-containing protein [Virgibacillus sp. 179-BFC.A HS]MDY0405985.1 DUF2129 domain-containing protein [Virgibacillus sp. 179-BFC.A HS]
MGNERIGMIVWFHHMKNLKQLKKMGNFIYASKRMKYAVIYVDKADMKEIEKKVLRFPFVSNVEWSQKPFLNTEFENAKPDKAKQYDYKMGI